MWPSGWREHTLRAADIEVTQFALDVLKYWEQSTPTDRYTNNPLGLPAARFSAPRALNGQYAQFPSMKSFREAFAQVAHSGTGKPLYTALSTQDKLSEAWRAINGLKLPANATETDYPAAILDAISDAAKQGLKITKKANRKTVGTVQTTASQVDMVRRQSLALHHAMHNIDSPHAAIAYIARRLS